MADEGQGTPKSVTALCGPDDENSIGIRLQRPDLARKTVDGKDFKNLIVRELNANNSHFKNCDFSYSIFVRAYFHNASFESCNFTGCRFYDCNLREVDFYSTDFKYARFQNTLVEARRIIPSLPTEPNLKRDLLQNLRANAVQIADTEGQKSYTLEEIVATYDHLWRALTGAEKYYQEKFPSTLDKIVVFVRLVSHRLSGFFWGHGERPFRLISSAFVLLALCSVINLFAIPGDATWRSVGYGWHVLKYTIDAFLGNGYAYQFKGFYVVDYAILLTRYLYFGLFISVLLKSISYR